MAFEALLAACLGWGRLFPRAGIPILCYHRVAEQGSFSSVAPRQLRQQMALLREWGYQTVGMEEVVTALTAGGKLPNRWAALTFDDAYRSLLDDAFPILQEFGFTASVFVPTDYVGNRADWDEGVAASGESVLSWEQIRQASAAGFSFYPHTVSHPHLTQLGDSELQRELRTSREVMEAHLGRPMPICCYPYGDYDARVAEAARAAGFQAACGLQPGLNHSAEQLWGLCRFLVLRATTRRGFRARVTGAFASYTAWRRLLRGPDKHVAR